MKLRVSDVVLLLVILPGAFLAWHSGREQSRLWAKYVQLRRIAGELPIRDPDLVYLRALETGDPLHFAWRMHFPANFHMALKNNHGSSCFFGPGSGEEEFIGRVRIRENEDGFLEIYSHFGGGSSKSSFGDQELAKLLRENLGKLRVEQLGARDLVTLKPDQTAVLVRVTLPDDLPDEARKKFSADTNSQFPVFFELELVPPPP